MKELSIKAKLLFLVIFTISTVALAIIVNSITSINKISENNIESYRVDAYKVKESELKNYVQVAINAVKEIESQTNSDNLQQIKKLASEVVRKMTYGTDGYYWINNSNHVVIAHGAKKSLAGKNFSTLQDPNGVFVYKEIVKAASADTKGGLVKYMWPKKGEDKPIQKFAYVIKFPKWDWIVGTGAYVDNVEKHVKIMKKEADEQIKDVVINTILLSIVVAIIISLIFIFLSNKMIIAPLNKFQAGLLEFFRFLNKETLTTKEVEVLANDEIGKMAIVVNENIRKTKRLIDQDHKVIEDVKDVVNSVSQGLLDKNVSASSDNASLNELKDLINDMLNNLKMLVGVNINNLSAVLESYTNHDFTQRLDKNTSGKIGNEIMDLNDMITKMLNQNNKDGEILEQSSNDLSNNVSVISENATSQAASLEQTAASIEEITGNIKNTNTKAQEMLRISSDTKGSAQEGKELASQTANSMEEINEQVTAINEAITVIDQIAFQTNILSLNAAVEAATAGEAGKGFAVVAAEVRNLASRSAEAAKEIKELVESATIKASEGKNISSSMIAGFTELEDRITNTNQLIDDVTNAAKEQTIGMSQIADAVNQLDKFTQENANIAEKTNDIARKTNTIAIDVVKIVKEYKFNQQ